MIQLAAAAEHGLKSSSKQEIAGHIRQIEKNLTPLDFDADVKPSPSFAAYCRYYGMDMAGIRHVFGTFPSGDYQLAAHVFFTKPHNAGTDYSGPGRGTAFLLHGYYDHTGTLKNLIRHCLDAGLNVAVFDLPGHGLSSGERVSIDDFAAYSTALKDFIRTCAPHMPGPFHLIGHSTGGAAILDYLYRENADGTLPAFKNIILLAPLIRSAHWHLSKTGFHLTRVFTDTVPRKLRNSSTDPAFIAALKNDPLQARHVSYKWVGALYDWNKKMAARGSMPNPLLVIQGTKDRVVDWRYNIRFLKKRAPHLTVKYIRGAKHQLANETSDFKKAVFNSMDDYIGIAP